MTYEAKDLKRERIEQIRRLATEQKVEGMLVQEWELVALCDLSLSNGELQREVAAWEKRYDAMFEQAAKEIIGFPASLSEFVHAAPEVREAIGNEVTKGAIARQTALSNGAATGETPRTDRNTIHLVAGKEVYDDLAVVAADFARQLERELAEAHRIAVDRELKYAEASGRAIKAERDLAESQRLHQEVFGRAVELQHDVRALRSSTEQTGWMDGVPPHPYDKEWFIAETIYGDRVVLTALPKEYDYDFKTADATYIRADKIKRWMRFPDSDYVAPSSAMADHDAERLLRRAAQQLQWTALGLDSHEVTTEWLKESGVVYRQLNFYLSTTTGADATIPASDEGRADG